MENHTQTPKSRTDLSRVPSPGSVSSVHSIRPLEWDSGADIGYQYKLPTGLSTVERIALVSGTVNFLETCQSHNLSDTTCKTQHFTNPLAHSSPFVPVQSIHSESENVDTKQQGIRRPLVNYSISSDQSVDQSQSMMNIGSNRSPGTETSFENEIKTSKTFIESSSRSLDDLRCLKRLYKLHTSSRSCSSSNILAALSHKTKKHNSSSSVTTVIPHIEQISDSSDIKSPRFVEKGVQVDEALLNLILCAEKISPASDSNKNSLEFFNRLYRNEMTTERTCSTYTIKNDQNSHRNSDESACLSNVESLDGGSFEYVPGSAYNNDKHQESSSDVNTMCSEVVDGVDLITRYVDNLRVSNKRKIIEKMAKLLITNVANEKNSKEAFVQCSLRGNSSHDGSRKLNKLSEHSSNSLSRILKSNSENDTMPRDSHDGSLKSRSRSSILLSDFLKSTDGSDRIGSAHVTKNSSSRNSALSTTSRNSSSVSIVSKLTSDKTNIDSQSVSIRSLKRFLAKEREAQLLWIQSGISHLNNLKKLYESHRQLKTDLDDLKKKSSCELTSASSDREMITSIANPTSNNMKTTSKAPSKSRSPRFSASIQKQKSAIENSATTTDQSADFIRLGLIESSSERSIVCDSKRKHQVKRLRENRRPRANRIVAENKENIYNSANLPNQSEKHGTKTKCVKHKPPICYTVLFDKKPKIEKPDMKTPVKKVHAKSNKMIETTSLSQLNCFSDNFNNQCSLQEYLLRNKPEYVYKAEFRRHCLSEIAKLRELRDKGREELISVLQKSEEIKTHANIPPPPLSVLRIFDDKLMKRETAKKYEQLPEIVSKKMELKKMENYRHNQIMAKVFTKKLQRKVLKGQVNLSNNANVISF